MTARHIIAALSFLGMIVCAALELWWGVAWCLVVGLALSGDA